MSARAVAGGAEHVARVVRLDTLTPPASVPFWDDDRDGDPFARAMVLVARLETMNRHLILESAELRGRIAGLEFQAALTAGKAAATEPVHAKVSFQTYHFDERTCVTAGCGQRFVPHSGSHRYCDECRARRGSKQRARCTGCNRRFLCYFGERSDRCRVCRVKAAQAVPA